MEAYDARCLFLNGYSELMKKTDPNKVFVKTVSPTGLMSTVAYNKALKARRAEKKRAKSTKTENRSYKPKP